jgi:hypothetical protein
MGALQVAQRGRSKIMSGRERSVQVYVDTAAAEPVLSLEEADQLIAEVFGVVKSWRDEATALGIRKSEQEQMASAFPA